jgi:hypothetical protein
MTAKGDVRGYEMSVIHRKGRVVEASTTSTRQSLLPASGSSFSNALAGSDAACAGDPGGGLLDTDETAEEPGSAQDGDRVSNFCAQPLPRLVWLARKAQTPEQGDGCYLNLGRPNNKRVVAMKSILARLLMAKRCRRLTFWPWS